jgi:predicted DNA repair protein MutK
MAAGSLLALLDDIATILDDVSILTKKAAAKTAGVLGDDLALNAQQVSGVVSARELPVVWAVAKGSLVNKLILVPAALVLSALAPWAVVPLLMVGGLYLCFEGVEKLVHHFWPHGGTSPEEAGVELSRLAAMPPDEVRAMEAAKIKGAVRTDFVLSAEIIAITLGTVAGQAFGKQVLVLSAIAVLMTVGVYGLVAGIVKLDDAGLHLSRRPGAVSRRTGRLILRAAPVLMKSLSVLGTVAMFLVGGGIVVHGIPWLHHAVSAAAAGVGAGGGLAGVLGSLSGSLLSGLCGLVAGALVLAGVSGVKKLRGAPHA